jgi:hypothetical protein
MNKLLYNNKNGCFKICNTCKDNDKLYKYVETIVGYDTPVIYTEFTKKNEGELSKKLAYLVQKDFSRGPRGSE